MCPLRTWCVIVVGGSVTGVSLMGNTVIACELKRKGQKER